MAKLIIKQKDNETPYIEVAGNEIPLQHLENVTLEMDGPKRKKLTLTYAGIYDVDIEVDETELIVKQIELP